ncbi:MAG: hypothetical protein ACLVC1_12995 [Mediterraneibacter gnavus]
MIVSDAVAQDEMRMATMRLAEACGCKAGDQRVSKILLK